MKESHEGEARREGCLPLFMTMSFQDSEVRHVSGLGTALTVHFSAAQVLTRPAPGAGPGSACDLARGYVRGLEIRCTGARWTGDLTVCTGRLTHGTLHVGPRQQARLTTMPLPFEAHGGVTLALEFQHGTTLVVHADTVAFLTDGNASFSESFDC